jgi:hypothetical protein
VTEDPQLDRVHYLLSELALAARRYANHDDAALRLVPSVEAGKATPEQGAGCDRLLSLAHEQLQELRRIARDLDEAEPRYAGTWSRSASRQRIS